MLHVQLFRQMCGGGRGPGLSLVSIQRGILTLDQPKILRSQSPVAVTILWGLDTARMVLPVADDARVSLPLTSFAVWYGRVTPIPDELDQDGASEFLEGLMLNELNISPVERELIFVEDRLSLSFSVGTLTDDQIYRLCVPYTDETVRRAEPTVTVAAEDERQYSRRVRSMVSMLDKPIWLRSNPDDDFRRLLASGAKAILVFGPPRTGKTPAD